MLVNKTLVMSTEKEPTLNTIRDYKIIDRNVITRYRINSVPEKSTIISMKITLGIS